MPCSPPSVLIAEKEGERTHLGHDHDVRNDGRVVLDSKVLARTTEAGLDLVDDEEDSVAVADLAHALEVAREGGNVASLAENGLDDDASRVARGRLLLEEELELRFEEG